MDITAITHIYLLYIVLPLWLLAAFADYWCHRASHIEATSGIKETGIHFLMLAEAGTAVLAGLFLEIDMPVLTFMLLALVAHEITAYWDVSYASRWRRISPLEQRVHDYLGAIPFMAFSFVLLLHWQAVATFLAHPWEAESWTIEWKARQLPMAYIVTLLAGIAAFDIAPYTAELVRDLRYKGRRMPDNSRSAPSHE